MISSGDELNVYITAIDVSSVNGIAENVKTFLKHQLKIDSKTIGIIAKEFGSTFATLHDTSPFLAIDLLNKVAGRSDMLLHFVTIDTRYTYNDRHVRR